MAMTVESRADARLPVTEASVTPAADVALVEEHSAQFKKELGLVDLVLQQIVYVVGIVWVGAAAKLGHSHIAFWLAAMLLFYLPQAAVVIHLSRAMPLEGGLYQWTKLGFGEAAAFMVACRVYTLVFPNPLRSIVSRPFLAKPATNLLAGCS